MNRGGRSRGARTNGEGDHHFPSSCEVYCGNLPDNVTEHEIQSMLGQGHEITKIKILTAKEGGRKFAIVRLSSADALEACVLRNGSVLQGRRITVRVADSRRLYNQPVGQQRGRGGGSFQRSEPRREGGSVSYGLVPCIRGSDSWFLIFQQSTSAATGTLKLDPFRGHQDPGESPAATAVRETHEESCHLFLLDAARADRGVKDDSETVFFVPVSLEGVGEAELTQSTGLLTQL